MKKLLIILAVVFMAQFGFSQKTTFKQDLIKYFETTGVSKDSYQRQVLPMIDKSKHEDFKKEFAVLMDDYYTRSAEVFQEEFSQTEIRELTSLVEKVNKSGDENIFWSSDIGKKYREKQNILDAKLYSHLSAWQSNLDRMLSKYEDTDDKNIIYGSEGGSYGGSGTGER